MVKARFRDVSIASGLGAALAMGLVGAGSVTTADATAVERAAPVRLEAHLRPSGDANGSGTAHFTFDSAKHRVCADVEWSGIEEPLAAHIHRSSGAIVVDLSGSVTGGAACTSGVGGGLMDRILAHPGRYYFNVHNAPYPSGAIQGRLRR